MRNKILLKKKKYYDRNIYYLVEIYLKSLRIFAKIVGNGIFL